MKNFILNFVKSNKFKTFLWTTLNAFIGLLIVSFADMTWEVAPFLIAGLNFVTKYINTQVLPKYLK